MAYKKNNKHMNPKYIQQLIKQGEGITLEFKTAQHEIPKNIFETVCAFLNRIGGTILLCVGYRRNKRY